MWEAALGCRGEGPGLWQTPGWELAGRRLGETELEGPRGKAGKGLWRGADMGRGGMCTRPRWGRESSRAQPGVHPL